MVCNKENHPPQNQSHKTRPTVSIKHLPMKLWKKKPTHLNQPGTEKFKNNAAFLHSEII